MLKMSAARQNNRNRKEGRDKCRQALSEHICGGFVILFSPPVLIRSHAHTNKMQAKGWGLASSRATSVSTQERMTPIDGNSYRVRKRPWNLYLQRIWATTRPGFISCYAMESAKGLRLCQLKMRPRLFNRLLRYVFLASRLRSETDFCVLFLSPL